LCSTTCTTNAPARLVCGAWPSLPGMFFETSLLGESLAALLLELGSGADEKRLENQALTPALETSGFDSLSARLGSSPIPPPAVLFCVSCSAALMVMPALAAGARVCAVPETTMGSMVPNWVTTSGRVSTGVKG